MTLHSILVFVEYYNANNTAAMVVILICPDFVDLRNSCCNLSHLNVYECFTAETTSTEQPQQKSTLHYNACDSYIF